MNHRWHLIALLLVVIMALAACGTEGRLLPNDPGDDTATGEDPDESLPLEGAWVLMVATVDGTSLSLNHRYRVTMTIDGSKISGRAACNSFGGAVSIDNGVFSLGEIAQTEMGCEPAVMEIESKFMQGLFSVTAAARFGDTASLTGEGVEYTFELVPPVPTAELIGSIWVLDTIIQGDAASSTVATGDPATLLLNADGTFIGGTGCREISGEYVVSGDTVQFTSFGAEGDCRSEVEWQDGQVVTVLGDGFTVEIDGDRLTVTALGGEALSYKAGPGSDKGTLIQVEVGAHFSSPDDGLDPGDALAGAVVRLYRGDTVVLETVLDSEGSATVAPEPGAYDVQVLLDSATPGGYCSWGDTVQNVVFPRPTLHMEAGFRCAGG